MTIKGYGVAAARRALSAAEVGLVDARDRPAESADMVPACQTREDSRIGIRHETQTGCSILCFLGRATCKPPKMLGQSKGG